MILVATFLVLIGCLTISTAEASATVRIVGGSEAKSAQFPHQISLRKNQMHKCGGAIISNNFILTAAHCVVAEGTKPYDAKNFTIRAGTHNRIAGGVIVQVKRIIVHEGYNGIVNDVALLKLEENLVFSATIQAIELFEEEVPAGGKVIITGWGLLKTNADNLPIILQWNTVEAISKAKCASKILLNVNSVICLNHPKGAGACGGDSGGPALYDGKLVGISNFIIFKCGTSRPDGYAKVSYHIKWIKNNMQ